MRIKKSHLALVLPIFLLTLTSSSGMLASAQTPSPNTPSNPTTNTSAEASRTSTGCVVTSVGEPIEDTPELPTQCSSDGGGQRSGNFIYYCQLDQQWNDDEMWGVPQGNCMLNAGCGPTSLAMVLSSFGVNMTPSAVDAVFKEKGWRDGCGEGSEYGSVVTSDWFIGLGMTASPSLTPGGSPDLEEMSRYVSEGYLLYGGVFDYPCLGCQTSGANAPGHVIVIDGIDIPNKRVHVRDPNNCKDDGRSEKTAWGWMSLTEEGTSLPDTAPFPFVNGSWNEMYAIKKK